MEISSAYTPYKPTEQTMMKRIAAQKSNVAQGKTGTSKYGGSTGGDMTRYAQDATFSTPSQGTTPVTSYSDVATPNPQYPYPQIQTPPYYQAPTPPSAINVEQALADTPQENMSHAQNVINAYKQFMGRLPDEGGYMAHLQRAVNEGADWNTIADWIRTSEEAQRYQAMRDVGLQIDPQLQAAKQAYERWMSENEYQKNYLQQQRESARGRYEGDYQNTLADIARAIASEQGVQRNEMLRRGTYHSGLMDAALQKISEQDMLARGRVGSEYARNMGDLESQYALQTGELANRSDLYGGQYNEQIANLMARGEQLMGKTLEQQLAERQEQEWREKLFEWEQEKFFTQLAQQAALARGGGGFGGGAGDAVDAAEGSNAMYEWLMEGAAQGIPLHQRMSEGLAKGIAGMIPGVSTGDALFWEEQAPNIMYYYDKTAKKAWEDALSGLPSWMRRSGASSQSNPTPALNLGQYSATGS